MNITKEEDAIIQSILKNHKRMDEMELGYRLQELVWMAREGK